MGMGEISTCFIPVCSPRHMCEIAKVFFATVFEARPSVAMNPSLLIAEFVADRHAGRQSEWHTNDLVNLHVVKQTFHVLKTFEPGCHGYTLLRFSVPLPLAGVSAKCGPHDT